jgi:hypothetical protein
MRILKPFQIKGIPDKGQSTHLRMDNIHITQNGVLKLLSNLNIHKAAGPDEIPTRLLKELAPYLAETFTTFFQASINQGTIPPD